MGGEAGGDGGDGGSGGNVGGEGGANMQMHRLDNWLDEEHKPVLLRP